MKSFLKKSQVANSNEFIIYKNPFKKYKKETNKQTLIV